MFPRVSGAAPIVKGTSGCPDEQPRRLAQLLPIPPYVDSGEELLLIFVSCLLIVGGVLIGSEYEIFQDAQI